MSQLNINALANQSGSQTVPIDDVLNGPARAWVNFDGTGVVSIRAAYNVDSITDVAQGDFQINFSQEMPDGNYSVVSSNDFIGTTTNTVRRLRNLTQQSFGVRCQTSERGYIDTETITATVFR